MIKVRAEFRTIKTNADPDLQNCLRHNIGVVDPDPHGPESRLDPDPHWVTDLYPIPGGQNWPAKKGNKCMF
jgi:hypothetical protein